MNEKDFLKIAIIGSVLFILNYFNRIFFLNIQIYNITNLLMFTIVLLNIFIILKRISEGNVSSIEYVFVLLIFLTGINIQYKIRVYLFLSLFFLLYLMIYYKNAKTISEKFKFKIISLSLFLISSSAIIIQKIGLNEPFILMGINIFILIFSVVHFKLEGVQMVNPLAEESYE